MNAYIGFYTEPDSNPHLTDIYRAGELFFIVCDRIGCNFTEETNTKEDAEFIGEQHESTGGNS